jgi:hypothetical protein
VWGRGREKSLPDKHSFLFSIANHFIHSHVTPSSRLTLAQTLPLFFLLLRSLPTLFFTSCIAFYIIIIADWNMPTRSRSPLMSWKNTRFLDDIDVDSASSTRPSQPKFERRSSYSLERFLQEPDEPELSPASSVEARHLDTTEFARRRKRMQSPSSSTGPYHGGVPPPVSGRRPRLLLMGQRRLVSRFPRHRYHLANTAAGAGSRQ